MRNRHLPALRFPRRTARSTTVLGQQQRLNLLHRFLHNEQDLPVTYRLAAVLLLLYAQPLTRISRLRLDDLQRAGGTTTLRLGGDTPGRPSEGPAGPGKVRQCAGARRRAAVTALPDLTAWLGRSGRTVTFPPQHCRLAGTPVDPQLRPCNLGEWSGRPLNEIDLLGWRTDPAFGHGGESLLALSDRSGGCSPTGTPAPAGSQPSPTHR